MSLLERFQNFQPTCATFFDQKHFLKSHWLILGRQAGNPLSYKSINFWIIPGTSNHMIILNAVTKMKNCNSYGGCLFGQALFPEIQQPMFVRIHFPNHKMQAIAMEMKLSETAFCGTHVKLPGVLWSAFGLSPTLENWSLRSCNISFFILDVWVGWARQDQTIRFSNLEWGITSKKKIRIFLSWISLLIQTLEDNSFPFF